MTKVNLTVEEVSAISVMVKFGISRFKETTKEAKDKNFIEIIENRIKMYENLLKKLNEETT